MRETSKPPKPSGRAIEPGATSLACDSATSRVAPDSALSRRLSGWPALALAIGLGAGVQTWAALHWAANLDGDEAIFGLIARHMLAGRFSAYVYGQGYLGTLEPALAAGLMSIFGDDIFVIRLSSVLLFALFLALLAALAGRTWGGRVALLSLLFLALPGQNILHWTYRPITDFGPMACCGIGMLLLARADLPPGRRRYGRLAAIGALAGIGLWSQPLTGIYIAALGLAWLLGTPEWRLLHRRLALFCRRVVGISARELLPVIVLGLLGLAVLVLFTGACEPAISFRRPRDVSRLLLLAVGASIPALLLLASRRRRELLIGAASLSAGFLAGDAPQWAAWLLGGVAPSPAILPACPTDSFVRLRMSLRDIYPLVAGLPPLPQIGAMPLAQRLPWLAALALVLAALAAFAWASRRTLWSTFTLAPLQREEQPAAVLALLLGGPAVMILLGGNTLDWTAVRYLLISWQAAAIVLALGVARLAARQRALAALAVAFWALQVGLGNLGAAGRSWADVRPYAQPSVAALQQFLAERQVAGGYADYWTTYSLSLATGERMLLAPYNGGDRYPAYTRAVDLLPVRAYLLRPGLVPAGRATAADLARTLGDRDVMGGTGPAFPRFQGLLRHASVLERRTVASWDVWIVRSIQ